MYGAYARAHRQVAGGALSRRVGRRSLSALRCRRAHLIGSLASKLLSACNSQQLVRDVGLGWARRENVPRPRHVFQPGAPRYKKRAQDVENGARIWWLALRVVHVPTWHPNCASVSRAVRPSLASAHQRAETRIPAARLRGMGCCHTPGVAPRGGAGGMQGWLSPPRGGHRELACRCGPTQGTWQYRDRAGEKCGA
eukprot:scaffold1839_cov382-Prasinococcus_capsulatus_cf.AAC.42